MRISRKIQDELVSSAKAGDTNAINELIVKLQPMIKRIVYPYATHVRDNKYDHYVKDELISECNLYIYKLIDKYKIESKASFFTYVYNRLRGLAKDYFRKEYKNKISTYNKANKLFDEFDEESGVAAHGFIADDNATDVLKDNVQNLINTLGYESYKIMYLYFGEGRTQEEIGEILNKNQRTIGRRIHKYLKLLKNRNNSKINA